jgi:deoxyribodipyrimidine photo-lyase
MSCVPSLRVHPANAQLERPDGRYVLYWMIAARRTRWNFALDRAVEHARRLRRPLLILEALRCGSPWASDRLHRFVLEGMADHAAELARRGVRYYPYIEPEPGAGRGLLEALARQAAVVVTDEFPCFFLPRMVSAAAARLDVLLETVDSNGLLPLRAAPKLFARAFDFRRFLQGHLLAHLAEFPHADPLSRWNGPPAPRMASETARRWPPVDPRTLANPDKLLARLPIDHQVGPAAMRGGQRAAAKVLKAFVTRRLDRYADDRNDPDTDGASGLSPYLHFGCLSAHEAFTAVARQEGWTPDRAAQRATGSAGWWGVSEPAEAFLDQLVTWRELGFNFCHQRPDDYDRYESLPAWSRRTLAAHARDPRPQLYDRAALEAAATHDPVWNAAQTQLVREGRLHNYLRMLWGKKILQWSAGPEEALQTLIELNNKYAVDGRDPNSYSGICWCLGRYDRAWGPERPIFGTVRYMSSEQAVRKLRMQRYLEQFGDKA